MLCQFTACCKTHAPLTTRGTNSFDFFDTSHRPKMLNGLLILFLDLPAFFVHLIALLGIFLNGISQFSRLDAIPRSFTTIESFIRCNVRKLLIFLRFFFLIFRKLLICTLQLIIPSIHRYKLSNDIPIQTIFQQHSQHIETNGIIQDTNDTFCTIGHSCQSADKIFTSISEKIFKDLITIFDILSMRSRISRFI